ncbi:MAG: hypothetical protein JSV30_02850 [Candidatus Omnitrophota bacterium]|nr:MAG: hypothetical protein JSV30_02850 [Candidatus Omnitrophota bacterium]
MILIFRKLYRLAGLVFPLVYFFTDKGTTLFWLSLVTFLFLILEIFRFLFPQFNRRIFNALGAILKEEEAHHKVLGSTYFLFGSLLTVIFFEKSIAIAALLFLIFGDAASALAGIRWGKIKIGKKSFEGSVAFFIASGLVAVILKYTYLGLSLRVSLLGAFAATLVELLPIPVDDNLSISLCSALVMAILN